MEATDSVSGQAASSPSSPALSSSQPPQREGASAEEPRALSTTAALAKEAALFFQSGCYQECLAVLNQILQKKEDDPKVIHNIAVAEYFRDGCTDPQKLLDILSKVKRKSEELAKAAGEQVDGMIASLSSPSSTSSTSGTRGNNTSSSGIGQTLIGSASSGMGSDSVAYMDDYDTFIPTLNTAVILYHLQQYATALSVLEPLYQNIEPVDEAAALRVCLLMLDISLASRQPGKAAGILQYMEKAFCLGFLVSNAETGSTVPALPSSSSIISDAVSSSGNISSAASCSSVASPNDEVSLTRTSSEEALDEEALGLGLDIEGSSTIRSAVPLAMSTNVSRISVERPRDLNLKLLLHLYKVRLLLLTHNLKATKREVKIAMNLARGHNYVTALLLKAQLEYCKANYRKAIKLLTTCSSKEPGMNCFVLNNLGCIHHQLRKGQVAAMFFLKALHSASNNKETTLKLSMFSQDKTLAILYNCAMQQLRSGNPVLAFRSFQEAGCLYYNQPHLWLRLAECCIAALEKGLLEASGYDSLSRKDELKVLTIGEGRWLRVILPDGSVNATAGSIGLGVKVDDTESGEPSFSNFLTNESDIFVPGKAYKLSMAFARLCLQNAAYLLDRLDARAAEATGEAPLAELKDEENNEAPGDSKNASVQKNCMLSDSKGGANGPSSLVTHTSLNGNGKENKGINGTSTISSSVSAYEEERTKETTCIRQYVLADLAFVELCLENPLKALKVAETLLQQPECTKTSNFLGHMYAAEACCLLNRPREAADHLSICVTENSSIESLVNGPDEDSQKWISGENSEASGDGEDGSSSLAGHSMVGGTLPETLRISSLTGTRARASLYVNLAAIHAMQGDLPQAHQLAMQAVSIMPGNPVAILSVVYVELLQGRTQEAVSMLRHCRHLCIVSVKKQA